MKIRALFMSIIVTSHVVCPGSILGRDSFLLEVFPGFSLNRERNVSEIWATVVPGNHMATIHQMTIIYHPNHIIYQPSTDGDGL